MNKTASHSFFITMRIFLLAAFLVAPVGGYAVSSGYGPGEGMTGAGFVLYVSLKRNAG